MCAQPPPKVNKSWKGIHSKQAFFFYPFQQTLDAHDCKAPPWLLVQSMQSCLIYALCTPLLHPFPFFVVWALQMTQDIERWNAGAGRTSSQCRCSEWAVGCWPTSASSSSVLMLGFFSIPFLACLFTRRGIFFDLKPSRSFVSSF